MTTNSNLPDDALDMVNGGQLIPPPIINPDPEMPIHIKPSKPHKKKANDPNRESNLDD